MSVLLLITYVVHIVISLFLILVVLLQQGKGADLSVFGGGASQAAFGARGAANIFNKLTVVCFVGFILTTLTIGFLQGRGESSVMSGVETEEGAVDEEAPSSLDEIEALGSGEAESDGAPAEDGATEAPADAGTADEATDGASSDGGSAAEGDSGS